MCIGLVHTAGCEGSEVCLTPNKTLSGTGAYDAMASGTGTSRLLRKLPGSDWQ